MSTAPITGKDFRRMREAAGMTQADFANAMKGRFGKGSVATVNRIEKGSRMARPHEVELLREALQTAQAEGRALPQIADEDTLAMARFWANARPSIPELIGPQKDPRVVVVISLMDAYYRAVIDASEAGRPLPPPPSWDQLGPSERLMVHQALTELEAGPPDAQAGPQTGTGERPAKEKPAG